jgi:hypothetical protein
MSNVWQTYLLARKPSFHSAESFRNPPLYRTHAEATKHLRVVGVVPAGTSRDAPRHLEGPTKPRSVSRGPIPLLRTLDDALRGSCDLCPALCLRSQAHRSLEGAVEAPWLLLGHLAVASPGPVGWWTAASEGSSLVMLNANACYSRRDYQSHVSSRRRASVTSKSSSPLCSHQPHSMSSISLSSTNQRRGAILLFLMTYPARE